jgi:glyoxalase family protein
LRQLSWKQPNLEQSMNVHTTRVLGIHHVTAMAGDPGRNLEFYREVLGLRLVKKTVNFDDPGTYHFYFGNESGRPGTILTFFPWPEARRGVAGAGQVTAVTFAVPEGSLESWRSRLTRVGVSVGEPGRRDGARYLGFLDPDGLALELIESSSAADLDGWPAGPVPEAEAVRGIEAVTLSVAGVEATASVLEALGFERTETSDGRMRFRASGAGALGRIVDLRSTTAPRGRVAAGSVHHVAFRAADDSAQVELGLIASSVGLHPTPVQDRQYFRSIYFREPGGVLFEIATDGPGFAVDESLANLGSELKLPPGLEPHRREIEQALPPLEVPVGVRGDR